MNFTGCIFNDFNLHGLTHKPTIDSNVNFSFSKFEGKLGKTNFYNFTFLKDVNFSKAEFKCGVYFNHSSFEGYADFHESKFEDIACFYGVNFKQTPIFLQTIFKQSLSMINTNSNFTFDELEDKIKQECEYFDKNAKEQDKKSLDKFANDFRDSFRIFKNVLIKDGNLLDASNYHKMELYCKEIELRNKTKSTIKDKLDKFLLYFYRNLCDHHTNLYENVKWLIVLIACYFMFFGNFYALVVFAFAFAFILTLIRCGVKKTFSIACVSIVMLGLFIEPKNIVGVTNLLDENINYWQNFITAIYIVLMALILYSLQKTARKNSIVPS